MIGGIQARLWAEKKRVLGRELAAVLLELEALKFGSFTLTSGRVSPYYIDLRILPSYPAILDRISEMYLEVIRNEIPLEDYKIAGIPTAGLPLATAVSIKARRPLIYVRDTPKLHGRMKMIEGVLEEGDSVILVDDLVTTGKSLLRAARTIRESGGVVEHAVVLIDREEGGTGNLKANGVILHSVIKITELLEWLLEQRVVPEAKINLVRRYLEGRWSHEGPGTEE